MSIHIVTDSTADIPQSVREQLGILMVPLKVHFGADTYLDSITLQPEQFYTKLKQADSLPTTSQPSPVDFLEVYKKILDDDPDGHIISIHLSAALSGTYQSAVMARSMLDDPERVTVIDSRTASYANGMLSVAAAEAARNGQDKDAVVELVDRLRRTYKVYFLVDTLEYLQKGGRIGKASAVLGSLLNIKPILSLDDDGEVAPVDKVRGAKKAVQRIIELLRQDYSGQTVDMTVLHSDDLEAAEQLAAQVKEHFQVNKVSYTVIGPVIGTHAGPGTLAVLMGPTMA
jgi:DegV family protein with EDD domain